MQVLCVIVLDVSPNFLPKTASPMPRRVFENLRQVQESQSGMFMIFLDFFVAYSIAFHAPPKSRTTPETMMSEISTSRLLVSAIAYARGTARSRIYKESSYQGGQ